MAKSRGCHVSTYVLGGVRLFCLHTDEGEPARCLHGFRGENFMAWLKMDLNVSMQFTQCFTVVQTSKRETNVNQQVIQWHTDRPRLSDTYQ